MSNTSRKEAIEVFKDIISKPMIYSNFIINASRVALASLEADEAYQLEYEQPELLKKKTLTEQCIACVYDEIENEEGEHCKKCLDGNSQFKPILKTIKEYLTVNMHYPPESESAYEKALLKAYTDGQASVEPKADKPKGRWTHISYFDGGFGINQRCSNCEHTMSGQIFDLVDNYCPNCGAKMIKPSEK